MPGIENKNRDYIRIDAESNKFFIFSFAFRSFIRIFANYKS